MGLGPTPRKELLNFRPHNVSLVALGSTFLHPQSQWLLIEPVTFSQLPCSGSAGSALMEEVRSERIFVQFLRFGIPC